MDLLRSALTKTGGIRRWTGWSSASGMIGVVNDWAIHIKPISIGGGGALYRPEFVGALAPAGSGSTLTGYIDRPGRRYATVWFAGVGLFLVLGLVVGLVGAITGDPVKSDQGTNLFPAMLTPPLIMLPVGTALHLHYSRLARRRPMS